MTIDALLGSLIGFVGTTFGVALTTLNQRQQLKLTERKDRWARQAELRKERREAVDAFIQVYQELEGHFASEERDGTLISRMWVAHNKLAYLAGDELHAATTELADRLNELFWSPEPWTNERLNASLLPLNRQFHAAVRSDLREE